MPCSHGVCNMEAAPLEGTEDPIIPFAFPHAIPSPSLNKDPSTPRNGIWGTRRFPVLGKLSHHVPTATERKTGLEDGAGIDVGEASSGKNRYLSH